MTATFKIQVSSEARRGLNRLPSKIASAVVEFITGPLAENPQKLSKPLRGDLDGYRSARRGDYRVLIRIIESDEAVLVVRIDHRADIYRPK
ncbi:MAG: type II toxin-antitoxin system RelE/ParE family toxin [Actinomycetota bacterium]|nr:type II toxin-antitoxin system RelE/ParE family toxin [Actinomycetota bacterium]